MDLKAKMSVTFIMSNLETTEDPYTESSGSRPSSYIVDQKLSFPELNSIYRKVIKTKMKPWRLRDIKGSLHTYCCVNTPSTAFRP